jgi:hypothetical protein
MKARASREDQRRGGLEETGPLRLSVGPVFDGDARQRLAGWVAIGRGWMAPGPFYALLSALAHEATWLCARFSLACRPRWVMRAESEGRDLQVAICGPRDPGPPRLELVITGTAWAAEDLRRRLADCALGAPLIPSGDALPPWCAGPRQWLVREVR